MRPMIALWIATLGLVGCGTFVTATTLDDRVPWGPATTEREVQVFASGPPSRPHSDLAILEARQTHGLNDQGVDVMIRHLRAQAAEIGCDAIVLGGFSEYRGARSDSALAILDESATLQRATCIVYTDAAPSRATLVAGRADTEPAASHQRIDGEEPR
jgi:hypothetical protein